MTLYNENDSKTAAWLGELIKRGHVEAGVVDTRSIVGLAPSDCAIRSHFFAGIGGWPYALQLAGWPADRPVWTGSCPCQPFSVAGKRKGADDPRHLWPEWLRLIRECRPPTIFGEQVASKDGRNWLSGVRADLETLGYAVGAADLCAAGVGAPHIRQRLYWVAYSDKHGIESRNNSVPLPKEDCREVRGAIQARRPSRLRAWDSFTSIVGRNGGRYRVGIESGTFPLAHGVPARVGRLRGYGNAIVPQVAAEFIAAFMEAER